MKILITENDRETANYIARTLNNQMPECQLMTTDSGKSCLEIVNDNRPDMVVLGLELSDISGFAVIKQLDTHYKIPVIALSRMRDEFAAAQAFNAGASGYMPKPIRALEFVARVKSIIRRNCCTCHAEPKIQSAFTCPPA
jgi:DNA-binding response OmpR family regulator